MYSFENIIGHQDIIRYMRRSYEMGKISHAYILEGEEGIGKKTLVNTFIKLLQCQEPQNNQSCHHCASCLQIESGNHPDIIYVKATKKSGYGVEDIREQVVNDIGIKPYQGPYKIYVIENADTMTVQAQNSLLKTIEEPPNYGVFFLLATNSQRFLQTILSRAVKLRINPIDVEAIASYLEKDLNTSEEKAIVYSRFSRGNLGKALMLKESEEFLEHRQKMLECLDIFINGQEYDIIRAVELFEDVSGDIEGILDILISLIRDILYVQSVDETKVIHQDCLLTLRKLATNAHPKSLIQLVKNTIELRKELRLNINYSLAILVMLTNLDA